MITFPTVLFRHPDTRGLPGSSCLNEEPQAQWTESLFHNQLTTIPHVWCQWATLSILGNWFTPAQIQETANGRVHERCFPAEVPEKTKVRLCGRAPPAPVPGTTLRLYYSSFLLLKLRARPQKVTVKVSFESHGAKDNQRYEYSYIGFSLFVYPKSNTRAARGI